MTPTWVIIADALDTFFVVVVLLVFIWAFVDGRIISKKTLEETIDLLMERINKDKDSK